MSSKLATKPTVAKTVTAAVASVAAKPITKASAAKASKAAVVEAASIEDVKPKDKKPKVNPTIKPEFKNIKGHEELKTEFNQIIFTSTSVITGLTTQILANCQDYIQTSIHATFGDTNNHFNSTNFITQQDMQSKVPKKKVVTTTEKKVVVKRLPLRAGETSHHDSKHEEEEVEEDAEAEDEAEDEVEAEVEAEAEEPAKNGDESKVGEVPKKKALNIHRQGKDAFKYMVSITMNDIWQYITPSNEALKSSNEYDFYIKAHNGSFLALIMSVMKLRGNDNMYNVFDLDRVVYAMFQNTMNDNVKNKNAYQPYCKFVAKILSGYFKLLIMDIINNMYVKKTISITSELVKIAIKNSVNGFDSKLLGSTTNIMRNYDAFLNLTDVESFNQQQIRSAASKLKKEAALKLVDETVADAVKIVVPKSDKVVLEPIGKKTVGKKKAVAVVLSSEDADDLDQLCVQDA
jgi:hypothetical protein